MTMNLRILLPALAMLVFLAAPARAQLPPEVQGDLLVDKITEAIAAKNYAHAERLFRDYEALELPIPAPLMVHRALVYYQLGRAEQALETLEAYLSVADRGSAGYARALKMYKDIEKAKAEKERLRAGLWDAAQNGDADRVALLINDGADINATDEESGGTPLHRAAEKDSLNVATLLINNGADINAKNKNGDTPLNWTAEEDSLNVATLLINNGADINAKNKDGYTSLHRAAEKDSLNVATLLINNGADINAKNKNGDTPLSVAKSDEMKALLPKRKNRGGGAGTGNAK